MDEADRQWIQEKVNEQNNEFPKKPTAGNGSGFFFFQHIHFFKFMNNNTNNPGSLGRNETQADPLWALFGALQELTVAYQEAGVPPQAARIAALADFECDFGVLPLAA